MKNDCFHHYDTTHAVGAVIINEGFQPSRHGTGAKPAIDVQDTTNHPKNGYVTIPTDASLVSYGTFTRGTGHCPIAILIDVAATQSKQELIYLVGGYCNPYDTYPSPYYWGKKRLKPPANTSQVFIWPQIAIGLSILEHEGNVEHHQLLNKDGAVSLTRSMGEPPWGILEDAMALGGRLTLPFPK